MQLYLDDSAAVWTLVILYVTKELAEQESVTIFHSWRNYNNRKTKHRRETDHDADSQSEIYTDHCQNTNVYVPVIKDGMGKSDIET